MFIIAFFMQRLILEVPGVRVLSSSAAWGQEAPLKGDLNGDGAVGLSDVVLGLQIIAKMSADSLRAAYSLSGADVDNNGRVGFPEILYDIMVAAGLRASGNPDFSEEAAVSGSVGSLVTLSGANFDPEAGYTVFINDTPAKVKAVGPNSIQFSVSPGTTSGEVVISDGQNDFVLALPFEVTRSINGVFNPPAGVSRSGYEIASGAEFTQPAPDDGSFSVMVPLDFTGIIWAFRDAGDPVFFAVVKSTDPSVMVDANSTAKALAFISPLLGTRDDAKTIDIFTRMDGLSALAALENLISIRSADGTDYLNDGRIDGLLQSLINRLVNPTTTASTSGGSVLAFETGTPSGTKLKKINPDYSTSIPATNARLDSQLKDVSLNNPRDYVLEIDTIKDHSNPLDWAVEVYEVALSDFPNGFASIDQLDHNETFNFLDERPVAVGLVRAQLDSAKLDIVEVLATIVTDKLYSLGAGLFDQDLEAFKSNQFLLPKDVPTVYVSQAFGGNLWYGTNAFFTPGPGGKSQTNILDSEDINNQWAFALSSNITIAAIDAASLLVDLKDFISREALADILQTVFIDVSKAVQIMQNREGGLNVENAYDLVKTTATALMKEVVAKTAEGGLLATVGRFARGTAKTLVKVVDVTGKISAVEQSLERSAGYVLPNALAVERSIAVIGDPFNPVIDRISPTIGQEGERVVIGGRNFGFPLSDGEYTADPNEDISVCFCQYSQSSTDPENQPSDTCLVAEMLRRTNTQISVTVPDDFDAAFQDNFPVYVCITKNGKETNSSLLGEKGQFELLEPPEIFAITPSVVLRGSFFQVSGNRFGSNSVAVIDDYFTITPVRVDDDSMMVVLPNPGTINFNDGQHTIKVKRGGKESLEATFTIGFPQYTTAGSTLEAGWSIQVTRADMTDESGDHEISILEAMRMANGSRLPELHLPCEFLPQEEGGCPYREREVDHVTNFFDNDGNPRPGGPFYRDTISVSISLAGQVLSVPAGGFPPVGNGDRIYFNGVILDGAGAGGHGLYLDSAVSNTTIREVGLRNFSGDGIRLENESKDNNFDDIAIETVSGNGISLFNQSSGNSFNKVTVTGASGHGIFIEGNSDFNNFDNCTVSTVTGSGIRIEANSVQNAFTYADQDPYDTFIPNIYQASEHGIHLTGGASRNTFNNVFIAYSGGAGIFLEGQAQENQFSKMVVTRPGLHGMHLSGPQVRFNRSIRHKPGKLSDTEAAWDLEDIYENAGGYGILIEQGANSNLLGPRQIYKNARGGIRLDGAGTDNNIVGKHYRFDTYYDNAILPSLVYDNGGNNAPNGHGVHISNGASYNTLELMNVAGNQGDGVLIKGSGTAGNHISGIWTGFKYFLTELTEPLSAPNTGNGLHIADGANANVIGGFSFTRNNFSNDLQNGVLINGVGAVNNVIQDSDIGQTPVVTKTGYTSFGRQYAGIGESGIALKNGASNNVIGCMETDMRVHVDASPDAGIDINESDNNLVLGCFMGSPFVYHEFTETEKNRIGIRVRNGAKGNRIGQIGPMLGADPNPVSLTGIINRLNTITHTREAGIWIENAGGSLDKDGNRLHPNVLNNNQIESDGVGLKISGNSLVNDIGGWKGGPSGGFISIFKVYTQEDNSIQGKIAGIQIDNVIVGNPAARNRLLNNSISSETDQEDPPAHRDLHVGPPPGVGVLITGNSYGNVVGESIRASNLISTNRVGIYIDAGHASLVQGNNIGSVYTPNTISGVVIRNGRENRIGRSFSDDYNILEGNGLLGYGFSGPTSNPDASGILIVGGGKNHVQGNEIGNNSGEGVLMVNTSGNLIGGSRGINGNIITANTRNGIAIKGNDSTGNIIQSNLIGTNRKGDVIGNELNGINLSDGASNNLIGGRGPVISASNTFNLPAPNVIAHNVIHGVRTTGSETIDNSILYNSIFQNGDLGIENENGGNDELPPPIDMAYGVGSISGAVADVGLVPAGSIINVFSDSGFQGEVLLGETTIKSGGSWTISGLLPAPLPNITATVTHLVNGSTSEFAIASITRGFNISRKDGQAPSQKEIIFGEGDIPVLEVEVVAIGDTVMVNQLTLDAAGSLLDDSQIDGVKLYRDNDQDGKITETDTLINGTFTYDADNGKVDLDLGIPVAPDAPQHWIFVYANSQSVQAGLTFSVKIADLTSVKAEFLFPIGIAAIPIGPFPVVSDEFTVVTAP